MRSVGSTAVGATLPMNVVDAGKLMRNESASTAAIAGSNLIETV